MTKEKFIFIVSCIFLIIGIVHIVRLLVGWEVHILDYEVPMWIYWLQAFFALYLSFLGFRLAKKETLSEK